MSTLELVLVLEHLEALPSPWRRRTKETRQRALPSLFVMSWRKLFYSLTWKVLPSLRS